VTARPGEPGPRSRAFVDWTLRWGKWLWAIALVLAVPATWKTARLYAHVRSDLEQLLPQNAPSVVAIDELRAKIPRLQHLGVVVDSVAPANLPAAERLLDDLASRVRLYPPDLVGATIAGRAEERKFVEDHLPLYMDLPDLETIRERVETRRDWEVARRTGALLEEDQPPPPLAFDDLEKKYDARTHDSSRFDHDHFANARLSTALLLIQAGAFDTGRASGGDLIGRVKADLAALRPQSYAPGLRVGFSGDIAIQVEETTALVADLSLSSGLAVALVIGVIAFYYRWLGSVLVLLPPLLLATVFALSLASFCGVRELNSTTAFLGAIIVGNGVNFGIVLLARYVEERRAGAVVREALVVGVWAARRGTLAAALAAGVSYASLMLTDFRGFRQFGVIGGLGMLFSWLLTFVLMPSLATWVDRTPRLPPKRDPFMSAVALISQRHPAAIVAAAAMLTVAAAYQARSFGPHVMETDFSRLRRADTWKDGEGYWGRRMDRLLGTYLTPTVILSDDVDQARAIGGVLRKQAKRAPLVALVAEVRTIEDVVPRDQPAKIAVADQIREDLTDHVRASLTAPQRRLLSRLLGAGPLVALSAVDLPEALTTGLRERDGTVGRTVLVFPRPVHALWEGPPLTDFVTSMRSAAATRTEPTQRPARVAGSLALSNDILESVSKDGPRASAAALFGVVAVVLVLLRVRRSTGLVLGSLLLGVLWLVGAAMALGIKINFANFIAFPITFGIGVDYSVNVASRWEQDGPGSMADAVRTTGGAVTLCSATTIIGYSSLLLAQNRALFLFGLLAVMGELACLSTAIVVLPAFVAVWNRPQARK
jgi:predicted RND superfamily exporter protein